MLSCNHLQGDQSKIYEGDFGVTAENQKRHSIFRVDIFQLIIGKENLIKISQN